MAVTMIATVASTTTQLARQDFNARKAVVSRLVEAANVPKVKPAKRASVSVRMLAQMSDAKGTSVVWAGGVWICVRWCNALLGISARVESVSPTIVI